jgi:hypothetical protein
MPVKSQPKERPIIEMLLSAYENGAWVGASLDWVEERQDGAVEVVATNASGNSLALEHTLIQPFVGEKFDSEVFNSAFGHIERNPTLALSGRHLDVIIPVHAIPKGYNWDEIGKDLMDWLVANHPGMRKDCKCAFTVPVGRSSKNGPLQLQVTLRVITVSGIAGDCHISRSDAPNDLGDVVEKALKTKIPKLVKTVADRRILLLERDQIDESQIYREIVQLAPNFPDLAKIDEIWFANTSLFASECWVYFTLMDGRGLLELLGFQNGILKTWRDDRALLGPPRREF